LFHSLCLNLINQFVITSFIGLSSFVTERFDHLSSLFFVLVEVILFLSSNLFFQGNHSKVSCLPTSLLLFEVFHLIFYYLYQILELDLLMICFLFLVYLFWLIALILYFLKTLVKTLNRLDFDFAGFLFIFLRFNSFC